MNYIINISLINKILEFYGYIFVFLKKIIILNLILFLCMNLCFCIYIIVIYKI